VATAVRIAASDELSGSDLAHLRALCEAAWGGGFGEQDFDHMFPGTHFLLQVEGEIASHGAVVERVLVAGAHALRSAFVENVATRPELQGRGHGTRVVSAITEHIRNAYPLGALDTGSPGFYERLGWELWRGHTGLRTETGDVVPTPEEDGAVMILRTPSSPPLDLDSLITCDWRPGDSW
jgi:aminoglycoside 2'-N-acetyltransferase I